MMDTIRTATPEDGAEMLRILESSASKGGIELLYTRRPDAYASYMLESGEPRVFVSTDGDRVVGTAAELIRKVYIGGKPARAGYVCGLKKDADYDGLGFGLRFVRALQRDDIDFYYCSVVSENTAAWKMFEKGRRVISVEPLESYTTFILNPKVRIRAPKNALSFRRAADGDTSALLAFLNREGSRYDLFPVVESPEQFHGLSVKDFCLLTDGDEIIATAALWNQTAYKQYVVKRYNGLLRYARLLNPLLSALGYIRLPREDVPLDFPMASFFLVADGHSGLSREQISRIFLRRLTAEAAKTYGILVMGLPHRHFATPVLRGLPSIRFDTKLYALRFPWSGQEYGQVQRERLYPECGLL